MINAHFWEFPNLEVDDADGEPGRAVIEVLGAPADLQWLCTIRHSITRYRIRLDVFAARLSGPASKRAANARWVRRGELDRLAFASAHRKILARL